VEEARTEVQKAFENYNTNTSLEAQQQLQNKKEELKQAYNEIQEEELDGMIKTSRRCRCKKQAQRELETHKQYYGSQVSKTKDHQGGL